VEFSQGSTLKFYKIV